ncbi:hypothetical protein [Streptomyces sp. CT34]|uniref:hypothetical protein n=1 Tax=Streptomyces sp. CT34 TaxID=1553907 RepID=UPI0012FF2D6D|nr:hypothetical protein [Streptomyces sp. CT34]
MLSCVVEVAAGLVRVDVDLAAEPEPVGDRGVGQGLLRLDDMAAVTPSQGGVTAAYVPVPVSQSAPYRVPRTA